MGDWKKAVLYIDVIDAEYIGFTQGQYWNGWECPAFEKEVARQILVDCEKDGFADYKWSYDESTDTFMYTDTVGEAYEDCQGFNIMVDGVEHTVYSIGSYGWAWNMKWGEPLHVIRASFIERIDKLRMAMYDLNSLWEDGDDLPKVIREALETVYPFTKSFDEVTGDVEAWYDSFSEVTK